MKLIRLLFIAVGKSVFKILNINDKTAQFENLGELVKSTIFVA